SGTRLRSHTRGRGFAMRTSSNPAIASHMSFWLDLREVQYGGLPPLTALLERLVDGLMNACEGLQAVLATWASAQTYAMVVLPDGMACGIGGKCTMTVQWGERFLRAVGETQWLGPALLAQLGTRAGLESVAETEVLTYRGLRVRRRSHATLDSLEQELGPLLPAHNDWIRSMDELQRKGILSG